MNTDTNNQSAKAVEEEGEKVTGGVAAGNDSKNQEYNPAGSGTNDTEILPEDDTKKEDMTGYNEHPDQEKVGGG